MSFTVTRESWDDEDGTLLRAVQRSGHGRASRPGSRGGRAGLGELKLETGTAQPDAIRFYEREGYRLIDNFGPYAGEPLSVCYARPL